KTWTRGVVPKPPRLPTTTSKGDIDYRLQPQSRIRISCYKDRMVGIDEELEAALAALARISHTTKCIGAANQRKPLCRNNLSMIRGAPRCRQSVPRISLDLNLLKDAKWWRRSTRARLRRTPERCFWARQIARSR